MTDLNYNGEIVNNATNNLENVNQKFTSIISSIQHATS